MQRVVVVALSEPDDLPLTREDAEATVGEAVSSSSRPRVGEQ